MRFFHRPIVVRALGIRKMALRAHRRANRPEPVTPSIHSSPLLHLLIYNSYVRVRTIELRACGQKFISFLLRIWKHMPPSKRKNCLLLTNNVKSKYILGVKLRKSYKSQALPLMLVNVAMMRILRRMMATAMVSTSDAWVKGSRLWWGWASVVRAHRHCCYLSRITA